MFQTGTDSMVLDKSFTPLDRYLNEETKQFESNEKPVVVKALVGSSVTTEDQNFNNHYQTILKDVFEKHKIRQEKKFTKVLTF